MTELYHKRSSLLATLLFFLSLMGSISFAPPLVSVSPLVASRSCPMLSAQSGDVGDAFGPDHEENNDGNDEFESEGLVSGRSDWKIYNDFPMFLTQCSLQSFLFLLKSMRDPQTVMWMENFTQPAIRLSEKPNPHGLPQDVAAKSQLLSYHGLHALNATRFPTWESFFAELIEQPEEVFVIESQFKQFPDYELDINPVRLCTRLLAVRQQIAREFVKDLEVLADMTNATLAAFRDALDHSTMDGPIQLDPPNLMFLELGADSANISPSPLRKGNFDLLTLLTTQEAIHRVLNDPERRNGVHAMGNKFLKDFYLARLVSHFTGSQRYRRADHFFEEMLAMGPNLQSLNGQTALVNPAGIAETLIKVRGAVALEWRALAQQVPEEHLEIQRLTLNQMMSGGLGTSSFEDALRGKSNVETKETEMVAVGEETPPPLDVQKLPPMNLLWNEQGANMNVTGVFE